MNPFVKKVLLTSILAGILFISISIIWSLLENKKIDIPLSLGKFAIFTAIMFGVNYLLFKAGQQNDQ